MAPRDPVAEAARAGEPDRYLAALYAPEPARGRLITLAAFQADLSRIAATVHEPLLLEIRLQWWRDALESASRGERTGHPTGDRLGPDMVSGQLPVGLMFGMIDATAVRDPLRQADLQLLRAHLIKSEGGAFALAARACGAKHSALIEEAARYSGIAYGLARLFAHAPREGEVQAGLINLCRQSLKEAAAAYARLDSAVLPAFLPLAVVPVYWGMAERHGAGWVPPMRRWWRLWRAGATGRIVD